MKKMNNKLQDLAKKAMPVIASATTVGMTVLPQLAFAANNGAATSLMESIIDLIAKLILGLAIILAIMGGVSYASAQSEGDGPAKNKAIGQLAAAVMLVVMSILLGGSFGDQLLDIFGRI